jgi:glucokinase
VTKVLGLDVGGSSIKWAVLDDGNVGPTGTTPTPASGVPALLAELVAVAAQHAGLDAHLPVGVALPGSLDQSTSEIHVMPNIAGEWAGVRPADLLSRATGRPWRVINDARAFAAGELVAGAARGTADALFVTLGTGVGGALVFGGRIQLGATGLVGEIGHVVVDPAGRPCGCGGAGCLEAYCGAAGILAEARRRGLTGRPPQVRPGQPGEFTVEDVFAAARAGEEAARSLVAEAGGALGAVLARVTSLLSPQQIVLGGGLSAGLPLLRPALDRAFAQNLRIVAAPQISMSTLGLYAGAAGAAAWAAGLVPTSR